MARHRDRTPGEELETPDRPRARACPGGAGRGGRSAVRDLRPGRVAPLAVLQADPPKLHFYRTPAGREVDFVLEASSRLVAVEAKASERAHRTDAGPLVAFVNSTARRGAPAFESLGLVVTRGREIEPLAPRVWAIPDRRLFGPEA